MYALIHECCGYAHPVEGTLNARGGVDVADENVFHEAALAHKEHHPDHPSRMIITLREKVASE